MMIKVTGQSVPAMQNDQQQPDPNGHPCLIIGCSIGHSPPTNSQWGSINVRPG